jgi:hypothetical protein
MLRATRLAEFLMPPSEIQTSFEFVIPAAMTFRQSCGVWIPDSLASARLPE